MKAIGRVVLIEPDKEVVEKTKGGLMLDLKNQENIRYRDATVISIGELVPNVIKEGDRVKYDKHAGHSIEIDGKYKVIKVEDIVGVL